MNRRAMALGTLPGPSPRFNREQAQMIRQEYTAGARYVDLQTKWRVSRGTISKIVRGEYPTAPGMNLSRGPGSSKRREGMTIRDGKWMKA